MPDFIPRRDADLLSWSRNLSARISEDPGSFFLSPQQAADYAALHEAYAAAYTRAQNPDTAAPTSYVAKDDARDDLKRKARQLAGLIRSHPDCTDQQRISVCLRRARQGNGARIPRPNTAPELVILSVTGRSVKVRLHDRASYSRKGKPPGVGHAMLFSFVGEQTPANLSGWNLARRTTLTRCTVEFPPQLPPGTEVWLTAQWENNKCQPGPACAPVYAHLGFGISAARRAA